MYYHKSFGALAFGLLFPRLIFRLTSKLPGPVVGANRIEELGATLSHYAMYGFIIVLPVSGAASLPLFPLFSRYERQ
jgi:cytochrome b561